MAQRLINFFTTSGAVSVLSVEKKASHEDLRGNLTLGKKCFLFVVFLTYS